VNYLKMYLEMEIIVVSTRVAMNFAKPTVQFFELLCYSLFFVFTARRNARIARAVLATAIPSVCTSVRPSVCLSHAGRLLCQNDYT